MTIGARIKKIRTEHGLSTYDLSKMTGISQSSISKLENGKRKTDNMILEKIATALNISIDRLTGDSVSCLIENRLEELNISLEDVSKKANVPLSWLQNLDSFIPGDMEFMITESKELDWDDVIGEYTSYKWITRVAEILGLPGSTLRAALARQEIPLPDDNPYISAEEAFGGINSYKSNKKTTDHKPVLFADTQLRPQILEYYNQLNDIGQHEATKRVEELTYIPQYRAGSGPLLNAAHEIPGASEEDKKHDDDIMDDENF